MNENELKKIDSIIRKSAKVSESSATILIFVTVYISEILMADHFWTTNLHFNQTVPLYDKSYLVFN